MRHIESEPSTARSHRVECRSGRVAPPARVLVLAVLAVSTTILSGGLRAAQQASGQEALPGIVNYTRIDAKLAVGGVLSLEALPELKRRGFKTVINLRKATAEGRC